MPSTQAQQICEYLIYYFYENILIAPQNLQSLFYQEHKIQFLIPDLQKKQFQTHECADIIVPVQKFIQQQNKTCEILAWSYQVLTDGMSIYTYVQYRDLDENGTITTADSFYIVRLPVAGSYAIKGYTCQLIR